MIDFKYDVQLLIEGNDLSEDKAIEHFNDNFNGDSLLLVGDETLIKVHFHTNEPWQVLEYCASLGDIHDIIVENMQRQANGLQG
ncbi:MAG: kinase to dihydroxyacetone kinase [Defluviitaleaceae bacterium]|nr:kinase to dihydroxyacetone kinase [Defluviitaleaceae bacterium]